MQLAIQGAKGFSGYTFAANGTSNLTYPYFKMFSQADFLRRLEELGIRPCAVDNVVTIEDPDGRKLMFGTREALQRATSFALLRPAQALGIIM